MRIGGHAYGQGVADGAVSKGKVAKVTGDDKFAVQTSATGVSVGFFASDAADGEPVSIIHAAPVFETDLFVSGVAAGDELAADAFTGKLKTAGESDVVIGVALSVSGGYLRFLSRI